LFVELKTLLHTLVLPPAGLLLLGLAGLWLLRTRAARRLGMVLVALSLGAFWLLATPRVADALLHAAQPRPALDPAQPMTAQAIVILGGGTSVHRAPEFGNAPSTGGALLERLTYGAYLAHRTSLPVLISGTQVETEAMRATLERAGVPTRWVESHSRDTFENAQFSAQILRPEGITRVLLVTSAAHEARASAEFASSGLEVVEAPIGVWIAPEPGFMGFVPSPGGLARSTEALYEILGDLARRCFAALDVRRHTT
jgi:uncharacterized SAM-binding protein YcdF (DUF218 family)